MPKADGGMPVELRFQLAERGLFGAAPAPLPGSADSKSKAGQLTALGWRIIPIPNFWAARQAWNDGKGGGNPAVIDFSHPREWLVVPPEGHPLPAQKIEGRIRAVRWAYEQATAGSAVA